MIDKGIKMELSRRAFFGAAACATAACGVAKAVFAAQVGDADKNAEAEGIGIEEGCDLIGAAYEVDVLVVGSGITGMCATTKLAEEGLSVLLCEAAGFWGGSTSVAEGCFAIDSRLQQEGDYEYDDADTVIANELASSNYMAKSAIVESVVRNSGDNINWMLDHGVQYNRIQKNTWHVYEGHGAAMIDALLSCAQAAGATCLQECRVKRAVMSDGKVVGAIVQGADGEEFAVKCSAIMLAGGGFAKNAELRQEKFCWLDTDRVYDATVGCQMGDSYYIAKAAGGNSHGMCTMGWYDPALKSWPFFQHISVGACNTPYLWINENAQRWIAEDMTIRFGEVCFALFGQARPIALLTQAAVDKLVNEGEPVGWGAYVFSGDCLTDMPEQLEQAMADEPEGFYWADSLDELAAKLDVDAATLNETVDRYRGYVEKGIDEEFGKDPQYLWEVPQDTRWYAWDLIANQQNCTGGVVINEKCEVVDEVGKPIAGLYAGGADASGLLGFVYPNNYPGTKQSFAMNCGLRGAESIAEYVANIGLIGK